MIIENILLTPFKYTHCVLAHSTDKNNLLYSSASC